VINPGLELEIRVRERKDVLKTHGFTAVCSNVFSRPE
jgi:hypothetical protein